MRKRRDDMPVVEQIAIPCNGATLLVEDVLDGLDVFLQAPDGSKQIVVAIKVENGEVVSVDDMSKTAVDALRRSR